MCSWLHVTAKNKVVVLTTCWLLQLHHVEHVGDNIITYNVEKIAQSIQSILRILNIPIVSNSIQVCVGYWNAQFM